MFNANIPALSQNFLRLIDMRAAVVRLTVLSAMLLAVSSPATFAQSAGGGSPVGMRQFEYIDPHGAGVIWRWRCFIPQSATRPLHSSCHSSPS